MGSFPSQLFKKNVILDLFTVAAIGLCCILTTFQLRDKGDCFSGSRSGKYLGPELHERGEGVLDMNLLTQVDHWRSPLLATYWITENCVIILSDPKSK